MEVGCLWSRVMDSEDVCGDRVRGDRVGGDRVGGGQEIIGVRQEMSGREIEYFKVFAV
jgi:hypothetical protein